MRCKHSIPRAAAVIALAAAPLAHGGPYSGALNDSTNPYDAPVPGFIGPHGAGKARLVSLDGEGNPLIVNPDNFVNPLFFAWAEEVMDYVASEFVQTDFNDPFYALGPVTGDNWDVVSLGDMTAQQIANSLPPGTITLRLARPVRDLSGADFVVFENGLIAGVVTDDGSVVGQIFGELAYVEVSADGENFTRFLATSLTPAAVNAYGSIDATNVRNLAGKHANAGGESWGTPFDLADVGLSEITHIRIVDIPGNGAFTDSEGRPIYDPHKTFGSGGFDLEAVGAISTTMTYADWPQLGTLPEGLRGEADDADGDGVANLLEYAFGRVPGFADGSTNLPVCRMVETAGQRFGAIEFIRDERLTDLIYEVQVSSSMAGHDWTTIARSTAGAALQALAGHNPVISESSASPVASIGVLRKVTVREESPVSAGSRRFFRVKVSTTALSQP
jgi:hypothetical protein